MNPERILITGSSGTLGHNLLKLLQKSSVTDVLAFLRVDSRQPEAGPNVQFERLNFFNRGAITRLIERFQPTCVIHCAASGMQFPKPEWFDLIRFNVDVSLSLCECVSHIGGCRFIYVSTGLAYRDLGRPLCEDDPQDTLHPYGASKAAADVLMRAASAEFGVPMIVVRPFSFTGAGDVGTRLFPSLLRCAAEGRHLDLSPGDQVRDHCAGEDIAAGILEAVALPKESEQATPRIYNLGSGSRQPLGELILDVVSQLNLKVDLRFGSRDYARFEPRFLVADATRANAELGWKPRKRHFGVLNG